MTDFHFVVNTKDTAQLDILTVSKTNHVIKASFSFCHSSLTCSSEHFIVGSLHRMMNREMFMGINIHITILENWHGYIQIYTNIGIFTNITKTISNSPTTFIFLQTLGVRGLC